MYYVDIEIRVTLAPAGILMLAAAISTAAAPSVTADKIEMGIATTRCCGNTH